MNEPDDRAPWPGSVDEVVRAIKDLAAAKAETAKLAALAALAQAMVDTLKEQTCTGHHPEDAYIFVEDVVVVMNALAAALAEVKP